MAKNNKYTKPNRLLNSVLEKLRKKIPVQSITLVNYDLENIYGYCPYELEKNIIDYVYEVHYKNLELNVNNDELKRFINEIEFLFSNLYNEDPTLENLVEIYEEIIRNIK
nr:MAG TPA: hypothetical protein [Caudoviricetes sp.]